MNKKNNGALLKYLVLVITVFLFGLSLWFYRRSPEVAAPESEIVLLPELTWGSYDRINQGIQSLSQKINWQMELPGRENLELSPGNKGLLEETLSEALRMELAERQALLAEELELRRRLIDMKIDRLVQQKRNQKDYLIKQAMEEQRLQQAAELADFRRQKEKEYSSKLATLHFQMETPDLDLQVKSRLTAELSKLKKELAEAITKKSAALKQALELFATRRQEAAAVELETYRRTLEAEGKNEFIREQQALEGEFSAWVRENEGVEQFLMEEWD